MIGHSSQASEAPSAERGSHPETRVFLNLKCILDLSGQLSRTTTSCLLSLPNGARHSLEQRNCASRAKYVTGEFSKAKKETEQAVYAAVSPDSRACHTDNSARVKHANKRSNADAALGINYLLHLSCGGVCHGTSNRTLEQCPAMFLSKPSTKSASSLSRSPEIDLVIL
jgi:hypothetical protein